MARLTQAPLHALLLPCNGQDSLMENESAPGFKRRDLLTIIGLAAGSGAADNASKRGKKGRWRH